MTARQTDRKPDWRAVTVEVLIEPVALMRVFADLGFKAYHGSLERGAIRWWQPDYLTARGNSPHRSCFGAVNRAMRDAPVHLLSEGRTVTAVCSYQGEWRTADGAQRGDDLPSLGALRWGCRYGQAAARIARTIGIRIPPAALLSPAAVFAEVHGRLREAA